MSNNKQQKEVAKMLIEMKILIFNGEKGELGNLLIFQHYFTTKKGNNSPFSPFQHYYTVKKWSHSPKKGNNSPF
jgi:hypothetical protein